MFIYENLMFYHQSYLIIILYLIIVIAYGDMTTRLTRYLLK